MAAALTITAASVKWVSGPTEKGIVGEVITAGQVVTGAGTTADKFLLCDADAATVPSGIALGGGLADGAQIVIAKSGAVIISGATVVAGTTYFAHTTAGGIGLETDLASGDFSHKLGYGTTTANIELVFSSASIVRT